MNPCLGQTKKVVLFSEIGMVKIVFITQSLTCPHSRMCIRHLKNLTEYDDFACEFVQCIFNLLGGVVNYS